MLRGRPYYASVNLWKTYLLSQAAVLLHTQPTRYTEVLIKEPISYSDPASHLGQVAPWLTKQLLKVTEYWRGPSSVIPADFLINSLNMFFINEKRQGYQNKYEWIYHQKAHVQL